MHGCNPPASWSTRHKRVLHEYLFNPHQDTKSIIEEVSTGCIPESELFIEAVPKEKELQREKARFFAKLTYRVRVYQTATESNIATNILSLFNNQSVTMSEDELTHIIASMNSVLADAANPKYLFISFDYQDWCKSMSFDSTTSTFVELDNIFGMEHVISYSQHFPLQCQRFIQDRWNPPKAGTTGLPGESSRSTRGATRWLEGMRQKGWTIFTLMILQIVSKSYDVDVELLAQGDNVVVCLPIPSSSRLLDLGWSVSEHGTSFVDDLAEISAALWMTLKKEETWISTCLFEYSRS